MSKVLNFSEKSCRLGESAGPFFLDWNGFQRDRTFRPRSADDGNIASRSLSNRQRRLGEPQLIHGHYPHEGEAQSHQESGHHHDPGEGMKELSKIPGAN